ncbi:MAG: glycoside hydrolase [Bacteroidales bacterium]|nr:glycoside hydrolase [Bacteroidales bacterium]
MKNILILFLSILLFACSKSTVKDYAHADDAVKSDIFELSVGNQKVFVEKFKDISYAHIELSQSENVTLTFNNTINDYIISPLNRNIQGNVNGNSINFSLPGAGYYIVTVNEDEKLFILANSPLLSPFKKGENKEYVSIKKYITDDTGAMLQTDQMQKALDEIAGTGKTLYFDPGIYKTGMLKISSNTNIYLEEGAMIKGSDDRADYPTDENKPESDKVNNPDNFTDNGEFMTFSRLIFVDNAENVNISGRGIIDGNGTVVRAQGKPANLIRIRNSKNVTIEGVILRDPAAWNTHILYSSDINIRNVKVLNDFDVANTDGFDPDASKNVFIENCFAYCNDDNVAIKTTNNGNYLQDLKNIQIKGCVFYTKKSALKVGTETKADLMKNILFENNDVVECDRGLVLYCNDGATFQDVRFVNNRIERFHHKGQQRGIHFSIKDRYGKGQIKDILIKDCVFYSAFPKESEVYGLAEGHLIENVTIDNLIIGDKKVMSLEEAGIKVNKFTENITFK